PGVVPAVADGLLGRARRALDEERRVAGDGGGEVLRHPGLGRAGHAEEEQGPVGGQRGDGDLDEAALPDVLRGDLRTVGQPAPEEGGGHGPGRKPPARRSRAVVGGGQGGELGGVLDLGVGAHDIDDAAAAAGRPGGAGPGGGFGHVGNSRLMTARRLRAWPRVWTRRRRPGSPPRLAAQAWTSGKADGSSRAARTGSAAGTSAAAWPPSRR